MQPSDIRRAVAAGLTTASDLGLRADEATVLHASNRIAVRLLPADVLARVAHESHAPGAAFEVEVARRLVAAGAPMAEVDPRVEPRAYRRDGFVVTLWTYYEPLHSALAPGEYAQALRRLHAGLRAVTPTAPHFTDRVAEAKAILGDRERSPEVPDRDRKVLGWTLQTMAASIIDRGVPQQLLHGEPHDGNLLNTQAGPLFIDLETCCRGPVEFDLAHAPDEVAAHYPGADAELVEECRILMLAMVTTWRWERNDRRPGGRRRAYEWFGQLQDALGRGGWDVNT